MAQEDSGQRDSSDQGDPTAPGRDQEEARQHGVQLPEPESRGRRRRGPVFLFWNNTRLTVRVDFLRGRLVFNRRGNPVQTLNLRPGTYSGWLLVNTTLKPGIYEYQVSLLEADIEAEGGSRPGIEIVP